MSFAEEDRDFIIRMNSFRINLIRTLKTKYIFFYGGIEESNFSRNLCPDIVVSKKCTSKRKYLKVLKKSNICIATSGLFDSIGWKFAEYISFSKAIVAEDMSYDKCGLEENKNFLSFSSIEECCEKIDSLLSNENRIFDIMRNNQQYYWQFLEPTNLFSNLYRAIFYGKN